MAERAGKPALSLVVPPPPERELLKKAQGGDQEAFRLLMEPFLERMLSQAFYTLKSKEDAQDVVQESLVKAFLNLQSFRGDSSFKTWLYRIVSNLCIDLIRKRRGTAVQLNEIDEEHVKEEERFQPDRVLEGKEEMILVHRALSELSDEHRQVVVLRELDGLSYEEIADSIGITVGTVMSRLHYGRKVLVGKLQHLLRR